MNIINNGKTFEAYLNKLCKYVNAHGGHAHKNNPLVSQHGAFIKGGGEPFDYEFFTCDEIHLFDAKECSSPDGKWAMQLFRKADNYKRQLTTLYNIATLCDVDNLHAYFLVWFRNIQGKPIVAFSPIQVAHAVTHQIRLTPEKGTLWSYKSLGKLIEHHNESFPVNVTDVI